MALAPRLFTARVMHHRLFPKANVFRYRVYYLALPLPSPPLGFPGCRFAPEDVGNRDGSDPSLWAAPVLAAHGLDSCTEHLTLITMPRVLGYVFNPVSFYLCQDHAMELRGVICEVHNTFGERHSYVCAANDRTKLSSETWLEAEKAFHVSPFLAREGRYRFRFDLREDALDIRIHYADAEGRTQLITSLTGRFSPLTRGSLATAFITCPAVTLKAMTLIHWQALKLIAVKQARFFKKPDLIKPDVTSARNLTDL